MMIGTSLLWFHLSESGEKATFVRSFVRAARRRRYCHGGMWTRSEKRGNLSFERLRPARARVRLTSTSFRESFRDPKHHQSLAAFGFSLFLYGKSKGLEPIRNFDAPTFMSCRCSETQRSPHWLSMTRSRFHIEDNSVWFQSPFFLVRFWKRLLQKNASYYLSLSLVISDFTLEFDDLFAGTSFGVIKSGWLV